MKIQHLLILTAVWIVGAGSWVIPRYLDYSVQTRRFLSDVVFDLKNRMSPTQRVGDIDFETLKIQGRPASLVTLQALYPRADLQPLSVFFHTSNCAGARPLGTTPAEIKVRQWMQFKCEGRSLPTTFFTSEPFDHPLGGTWVAYAHDTETQFQSRSWLESHRPQLHVLEQEEFFPGSQPWLSWIDNLAAYQVLFHRTPAIFTKTHFLLVDPDRTWAYNVFRNVDVQNMMRDHYVESKAWDPQNCQFSDGFICWSWNRSKILFEQALISVYLLTVCLLAFVIYRVIRHNQRQIEARAALDRQLLVQTLAHELRHPATGLKLSIEVFRDHFDHLSDDLKTEFLRMTGQLRRLQRLITASQQYLHADGDQGPFQFQWVTLPSLNEFVEDLLEPYREKVDFTPGVDGPLKTDAYWLGMCITNLIKNSLTHGQRPIRCETRRTSDAIVISVMDAGPGLRGDPNKILSGTPQVSTSAAGMGLGLSLIVRILRLMGAELQYNSKPQTTFSIRIPLP